MRVLVDDLYLYNIVRMSKKHVGVRLIGVANKNPVFAMLMGLIKLFKA
jgi:hypothetical protein